MVYNITNVTDANSIFGVLDIMASSTDYWMVRALLYGTVIVIIVGLMQRSDNKMAPLIAGSFIGTLLSGLFLGLDWVAPIDFFINITLLLVSSLSLFGGQSG